MASKFELTVVVSGAPQGVTVNQQQQVHVLVDDALKEAGIKHPDLAEWQLRAAQGGPPIPFNQKIEAAGIHDGETLFLDQDEGGGGTAAA
jgi:hypothetical protein